MDKMTVFKAQQWAFSFIKDHGKDPSVVDLLLQGQLNWSTTEMLMNYQTQLSAEQLERFFTNVKLYCQDWPAQYLLGKANFFGLEFKVNEATLIPRPETEELVEWILETEPKTSLRVLDIGTGTGAIGLSLKHERPAWEVALSDISPQALAVAKENKQALKLEATLIESDLFQNITGKFDVIVSNPPYIAESEADLMDKSVLEHEPKTALFAPDEGLYLYKKLAEKLSKYLTKQGKLYLEIGFQQGPSVVEIFSKAYPTAKVQLRQDITGHDRMVKVSF